LAHSAAPGVSADGGAVLVLDSHELMLISRNRSALLADGRGETVWEWKRA